MPAVATPDRRLIINADDFGLSAGVNAGILEAVRAGIVTSVSVMSGLPAFTDGMRALAALASRVSVGLHVNFTAGSPVSRATDVPSLVDAAGRFRPLAAFVARSATGRIRAEDLAREACAQLDRLRAAGPDVTHLDSHQHVHALPAVAQAMRRGCGTIPLRRPVEPVFQPGRAGEVTRLLLALSVAFMRQGPGGGGPAVRGIGMHGRRRYLEELLAVIDALPAGLTELIVHPGHADPGTLALDPYDAPREAELDALLSGRLRERLARGDVVLAAFDAGTGAAA